MKTCEINKILSKNKNIMKKLTDRNFFHDGSGGNFTGIYTKT